MWRIRKEWHIFESTVWLTYFPFFPSLFLILFIYFHPSIHPSFPPPFAWISHSYFLISYFLYLRSVFLSSISHLFILFFYFAFFFYISFLLQFEANEIAVMYRSHYLSESLQVRSQWYNAHHALHNYHMKQFDALCCNTMICVAQHIWLYHVMRYCEIL